MTTARQLKAIDNMVENGGNVSKAMKDAGYSEATANTPQKLTESKGFMAVMDAAGITEQAIADGIKEGMQANRAIPYGDGDVIEIADHAVRHKFIETAIKVRGMVASDPQGNTFNFINNANFSSKKYVK